MADANMVRGAGQTLKHSKAHHTKKNNLSRGGYGKMKLNYSRGAVASGQYRKPGLILSKSKHGKPIRYSHEISIPYWMWIIIAVIILAIILMIAL